MIAFWIAAALLSAAVATLIVLRAARAQARKSDEDPTLAVYRRQLSEIDDLAARGLLPDAEQRSARTEAARRLLAAADAAPAPAGAGRAGRTAVIVAAALVPLVAVAAYLAVGSPQTPDQPYARRLAVWTAEASNNETADQLTPPELAAVLRGVVARRPADPVPLVYLAHAEVDSDDPVAAEQDLKKAIALDPNRAELWQLLGETFTMQAGDDLSPDARAAFERATALDPKLPAPHYYLGRAKVAAGDVSGGLAEWNTLLAMMPADSPAHAALERQIAAVQKSGTLPASPEQQTAGADQQAMIRAMVSRLAARLKAQPDDPEGWGRLIRSYAVLGDEPDRAAAINEAQAQFKNRPDALARVEQAEAAPQ